MSSTERPETPQRGRGRLIVGIVLAALLVGGGTALGAKWLSDRSDGVRAPGASAPPRRDASHLLLVIEGEGESFPAFGLVALTDDEPVVLTIPATLILDAVPGVPRPLPVTKALSQTGNEGLAVSIANVLGIRVPAVLVGPASAAWSTVDGLGGVTVDIPEDIVVEENGEPVTVFAKGRTQMDGVRFVNFMTTSFSGELELDRVTRQTAGWRGLLEAVARRPEEEALRSWSGDIELGRAVALLGEAATDTNVMSLPVEKFVESGVLEGDDQYKIDKEELEAIRTELAPFKTWTSTEGRRIRLLIDLEGQVGPAVGRKLVDAGYLIELTGTPEGTYEQTQVVVQECVADAAAAGQAVIELLGTGEFHLSNRCASVMDIILVVAKDWAEANGFPQR